MSRKFSVLVVDDEKLIARAISRAIEKASDAFQVLGIAGDGLEAYALTKKLLPDVVFSDIKMPEMDGITLIKRIHAEIPAVKTVIISGYSDFELARSALRNNAVDYLLKPVDPRDLQRVLQKLEADLLAEKNKIAPRRENNSVEIVENVIVYLQQNFAEQVDFSQIAKKQGFSTSYLSKIFREQANTTPAKYLNSYRMQVAKKLLASTAIPVKEIAAKVGFSDPFHFSRNFKKTTGHSPAHYREHVPGKPD